MRVRGTLTLVAELMDGGASDDAKAKETKEKKASRKNNRNRTGVRDQRIHVHSSIYQVVFFSVCHLVHMAVDSSTLLYPPSPQWRSRYSGRSKEKNWLEPNSSMDKLFLFFPSRAHPIKGNNLSSLCVAQN
jgi:hypothetical protein